MANSKWLMLRDRAAFVFRASRLADVSWPSGRTTQHLITSTAVMSELEEQMANFPLRAEREANAWRSLDALGERVTRHAAAGWLLTLRKRGKVRARRIAGLEWR